MKSGGIGLAGILGVVFITLKLTGHITWSWWWVMAPFWLAPPIILLLTVVFIIIAVMFRSNLWGLDGSGK